MKLYKATRCHGDEDSLIIEFNKLENIFLNLLGNSYAIRITWKVIHRLMKLGLSPSYFESIYATSKRFITLEENGTGEIEYGDKSVSFYGITEIGI